MTPFLPEKTMTPRLSTLFIWCAVLLLASASQAQVVRPSESVYALVRGGAAIYHGDVDGDDAFGNPGFSVGAELGYLFNPNLSLGLGYTYTYHERLSTPVPGGRTDKGNQAHQGNLLFRYLPFDAARLSPFVELGGAIVFGQGEEQDRGDGTNSQDILGYGPVVGLGVDFALSPQFSLFLAGQTTAVFPDAALDGADPGALTGSEGDDWDFDLLTQLGGGFKYAFRPPYVAAEIESLQCPSELVAGESGSFTVMTNEDATAPVTTSWEWGDGTTGSGMTASHAFASPGTYTVTAMVSNEGGDDSESCLVTVVQRAPTLAGCRATPATVNVGEEVSINATATDADDITVDFGDGTTATTLPARHAYSETGTYTVTITASNTSGEDMCTTTVTVGDSYCADITELNPVFFGYGASTLTADARARLDENIEILRRCPDICVTIYGWTDDAEDDEMRLSQRRADAVMEYYVSQGIDADRLRAEGRGQDPDANSKEDPGPGDSRARRADSIPSSCAGF